jgi:hypothetical protein
MRLIYLDVRSLTYHETRSSLIKAGFTLKALPDQHTELWVKHD